MALGVCWPLNCLKMVNRKFIKAYAFWAVRVARGFSAEE